MMMPHPRITHYVEIPRPTGEPFRFPAYVSQGHMFAAVEAEINGGPIRVGDHLAVRTSAGWQKFDHVRKRWVDVRTFRA